MEATKTTKTILKSLISNKINLDFFDSVNIWINDRYTNIYITLASVQVSGGNKSYLNRVEVVKSVACFEKHSSLYADDLVTDGWKWISDLKD